MTSRKKPEYLVVGSIAISYILKLICSLLHKVILSNILFSWYERAIVLLTLSIVISVATVFLSEYHTTNKLLSKLNNKTIHESIWHDIINYKDGTTLCLVCDNAIYTGVLAYHEEKGEDSWFALDDYIIEENGHESKAENISYKSRIAIRLKDVRRVELYYGENDS